MKIKRTAWHFRLYCFTQTFWKGEGPFFLWEYVRGQTKSRFYEPTSLCPYFWAIVLSCLSIPIITVLAILLAVIAFTALAFCWPFKKLFQCSRRARKRAKSDDIKWGVLPTPKEPSLVASFIKAKKSKVCPIIEIVD